LLAFLASPIAARAATFDQAAAPGANYDKAEFRLWLPDTPTPIRALVVLVPGSNGDGRGQVDDAFWQSFAAKHRLGLVGCRFTDKPHDQMFIEEYVDVSKGSGQALLDALQSLARQSHHPEIATAPMLLWGMSAGGEFNYEFTAWKPERVIAFIVNKGNVYYTALAPEAARRVPGIMFTGEQDLDFRIAAIDGLFAINRRAGALWAYAKEPGVGHAVAHSREFAAVLFADMLAARVSDAGALKPLDPKSGLFGDAKSRTVQPNGESKPPAQYPVSWLPNDRVARAWLAVSSSSGAYHDVTASSAEFESESA
jgi:poly(3-hydroxybutyrate) depolymerase